MARGRYAIWLCLPGMLWLPIGCTGRSTNRVGVRDPISAVRCNEEGLKLVKDGRYPEACEQFRRALEADHYYGPAHSNLGVCLIEIGSFYEAGVELRYATQLMPKAAQPRANLGILYETVGRYDAAEEHLRAALRLEPEDIEIIGHLARIQVDRDVRTDETLAWLQTIATQDDQPAWRRWANTEIRKQGFSSLSGVSP